MKKENVLYLLKMSVFNNIVHNIFLVRLFYYVSVVELLVHLQKHVVVVANIVDNLAHFVLNMVEGNLTIVVADKVELVVEDKIELVVEDKIGLVVEDKIELVFEDKIGLVVEDKIELVVDNIIAVAVGDSRIVAVVVDNIVGDTRH